MFSLFGPELFTLVAVAGNFPAAFTAVYVVGAIAAFGIGFFAVKKAREVNIASFEEKEEKEQQ